MRDQLNISKPSINIPLTFITFCHPFI
jgi:xylulose-5-phosphate/fructose-6-phosphate phosphoketolase